MVSNFCKAEDFQQITEVKEGMTLIRFSKEPIIEEVYEDYKPTGKFEDTGLVRFTEECILGNFDVEAVKNARLEELKIYDSSVDVNALIVNGKQMWFDKITRTCINYSMQVEKESGNETTTLYDNDGIAYELPIDSALNLFAQLELYAKTCYNKTAEHRAIIQSLDTIEDLLNYNIKTGYPEKLNINI